MVFAIVASNLVIGATAAAGSSHGVRSRRTASTTRVVRMTTTTTNNNNRWMTRNNADDVSTTMGVCCRRAGGGRRPLWPCTAAAGEGGQGEIIAATTDESSNPSAASAGAAAELTMERGESSSGESEVDVKALWKYVGATAGQTVLMIWFTMTLDVALERSALPLVYRKVAVGVWFLFNALKSRTFSPLNASRPKMANEKSAIAERKRPSWMPPPLAFPIIWSTIALLRAVSSVAVYTAAGTLNNPALFAMVLHLAVGDTWNSINNVEKRLGTAVLGVCAVLLSVYNVVFQYYQVLPKAGYLIAPSAVWISVATFLVYTIWRINPRPDGELEPLLPMK